MFAAQGEGGSGKMAGKRKLSLFLVAPPPPASVQSITSRTCWRTTLGVNCALRKVVFAVCKEQRWRPGVGAPSHLPSLRRTGRDVFSLFFAFRLPRSCPKAPREAQTTSLPPTPRRVFPKDLQGIPGSKRRTSDPMNQPSRNPQKWNF